jgi:serine protease Do
MMKRIALFLAVAACAAPGVSRAQEVPAQSLAPLVRKLKPAVVNIYTTRVIKPMWERGRRFHGPGPGDDPFEQFFRFFGPPPGEQKLRGQGSGFIYGSDGLVVTNNHVVQDADEVRVKLEDGRTFDAKVVGRDPSTDVALIRINDKKGLPAVTLGDSDKLEVGDWVVAIGNPFGLSHTVTAGIVSAKARSTGGQYDDFIQTDAAINPGNSGGPLFNLRGEVVGINAQILGPGANIGIGFAIPINLAKSVVAQLRDKGKVVRGYLGIGYQGIDDAMAKALGLDKPEGALVREVVRGGPADKAGVQPGDVIVEFNGRSDQIGERLAQLVATVQPGSTVKLLVRRERIKKELSIKVGTRPDDGAEIAEGGHGGAGSLGVTVEEKQGPGVVVTEVAPDSPAAGQIEPGDVILEVNRKKTDNLSDFRAATAKLRSGETVLLRVRRGDSLLFLAIPLG